jgi:hypothetical protein
MKFFQSHRSVLIFVGAATAIALVLAFGAGQVWAIDALGGLLAAAAAFLAFVRLALGTPNAGARRVWQAALVLLTLVCIAAFVRASLGPAFPDAANVLLVAAALAVPLVAAWLEPMPGGARALLWVALAVQLAGTAAVLLAPGDGPAGAAGGVGIAVDLLRPLSLALHLLGLAVLVAFVRRQIFVVRRCAKDVGDLARYLFTTSRLFKKVRHPRIGNYTVPGHRLVFMVVRFVSWFPRIAPKVRDEMGVGLWKQFCDLIVVGLRHGLDAQVYYMFELYRPERRERASGYLTRYELKNGLFKVLTWQVSKSKRRTMLGDKLGMYRICEAHGIPTVPILVIAEDGKLEYRCNAPADLERDLFIKPRQAKGSKGTELVRYAEGKHIVESGAALDHGAFIAYLERRSKEESILVQPRITNHPGLADLAEVALMRIRAITCLDTAGTPVLTHAVLSNLCKLETNWPTDIEFGAAIDLETGSLGPVTGDKAEMWLNWGEDHPMTGARMRGRTVPCWDQVRSIALAAHAACKDRLLVGWDIAVGPNGAVLLEGNSYPDVDFLQRSHQCAIADSVLGVMLYDRLVDIERRSAAGTLRGPMDYD